MKAKLSALAIGLGFALNAMANATVTFNNYTSGFAHEDYSNCALSPATNPATGNLTSNNTTFQCAYNSSSPAQIQLAQYGTNGVLYKCYVTVNMNSSGDFTGFTADSSNVACNLSVNSANMSFGQKPPQLSFAQIHANLQTAIADFVTYKPYSSPTPMIPNVIPMTPGQLSIDTSATGSWALQYGYDATRYPMWNGAYCLQYANNPATPMPTSESLCQTTVLPYLTSLMKTINNASNDQNLLPGNGIWAYTFSDPTDGSVVDGTAVTPSGQEPSYALSPALDGPAAIGNLAVGNMSQYTNLTTALNAYSIANNPPSSDSTGPYVNTSGPYFNATLDLISEALLVGGGELGSTNTPTKYMNDYVSEQQFQSNFTEWNTAAFLASFTVIDAQGVSHTAQRVLFSIAHAPNEDGPAPNYPDNSAIGNSATVSEGQSYGLLIAYAAGNQTLFNQLMWFYMYEAQNHGCAAMTLPPAAAPAAGTASECTVQSKYLMPWMVDETGAPFHYQIGGGYLTNGSATDADIDAAWAASLAATKWPTDTVYGMTYMQIAKGIESEVAKYDVNYYVPDIKSSILNQIYAPGSQWSTGGLPVVYPGYDAPQAFDALDILANSGKSTKN
ncbi:MAG: glycosyl hydrolase family 8 [Gammaproteobacteria bacterium]|nr:glycosyl hydrolase family 8 [Gammaproteobacteria bacterium]